ncbi:MAG TPA: ADOP family duplicated permease [Myxococcales bacterium]|nr:ADOP family duplicated permease [Myxococcales bacterium]
MLHDLRSALRQAIRAPGFAAVVIVTIGVAIGATTSVFSVVRGLLLRPLPFREPGRLVRIYDGWKQFEHATPSLAELRLDLEPLRSAAPAAWAFGSGDFQFAGGPEHVLVGRASSALLPVLGVQPALGRWFTPDEEQPGNGDVLVIGPGLWKRRFNADPAVVGSTVQVSGRPMRIVGVLADDLELPESFEAFRPLAFPADRLTPQARGAHFLRVIARLRGQATLADLRSELSVASARLRGELPAQYPPDSGFAYVAEPLLDEMVGSVKPTVWMLFAAVLLVLLMACANVGNLMLARAAARGRELAVRAALGAGRARLVRQMLVESLLLALAGGALGVALALWGVDLLIAAGPRNLPRANEVRVDGAVLAFALAAALLSGALFGLLPALTATQVNLEEALRAAGTAAPPKARRLRRALVAADVALAVVLVCGAALMLRSLARVVAVDPGFRPDGAVALQLTVPGDAKRQLAVFDAVLQRLRELPGAVAAGGVEYAPLSGVASDRAFALEGHPVPPGTFPPDEEMRVITPGWLEAMGVPLLRGRTLQANDPERSIAVNEAFARKYFGGEAIGRRIVLDGYDGLWTVVGVVADVHDFGLDQPVRPTFYLPLDRWVVNTLTLVLRSSAPPADALRDAVRAVTSVDPTLPAYRTEPVTATLRASLAQRQFTVELLHAFAALAILLAGLGLYGVLSYSVSQRVREMGVRMALGARPSQAVALVARESAAMVAVGLAAGCAGALAAARVFSGLLFGVGASDPLSLAAAVATLGAVAAAATLLPARRAAQVDPAVALRAE